MHLLEYCRSIQLRDFLNISFFFYFILLLHYILDGNRPIVGYSCSTVASYVIDSYNII